MADPITDGFSTLVESHKAECMYTQTKAMLSLALGPDSRTGGS